jgi:hypothetical protein
MPVSFRGEVEKKLAKRLGLRKVKELYDLPHMRAIVEQTDESLSQIHASYVSNSRRVWELAFTMAAAALGVGEALDLLIDGADSTEASPGTPADVSDEAEGSVM